MSTWKKKAVGPLLMVVLAAPVIANCGGGLGGIPGAGNLPGVPGAGACPNMSNADEIAAFDWQGNYKVDAKVDAQLKAGLGAAADLQGLAASLDADLKTACGAIVKDLGGGDDYKTGEDACKVAVKIIGDVKAKLGAKLKLTVDAEPPKCSASLEVVGDCSAKCDVSASGGSAKVECEPGKLQGECSAQCEGKCEASGGMKCAGSCSGKCDAAMSGSCGGNCDGKCDGKDTKGACAGKCDGKCDAEVKGTCSGSCSGSCELKAKAECKGTCSGSCSVEMKAPKCTGTVTPPKVSADCKAKCDAHASAKAECTPAHVVVRIEGGADAALQAKLKMTIDKNFPLLLKVALGMADRAKATAEGVGVVVSGAQAAVSGAVSASPTTGAQLTACVSAPFKGAVDAAASVKASVSVSVNVSASASASGRGGAATK